MSKLAVLSLKNRALIALITIVSAIFGSIALTNLKQELIPSIEFPALTILTVYPGASPEVVSNDVSQPVEAAIQAVPGLEDTTATSTTNASIVFAEFSYGTNLATAEQKIDQALGRIESQLPDTIDQQVLTLSIDDLPVIQIAVTGSEDAGEIQDRLDSVVVPAIEELDGVNLAQVVGGRGDRITIVPDQAALAAAGYSQTAITDAMEQNGTLFPGGEITEGDQTLTVQSGTRLTSVEEIAALPLVPTDADQIAAGTVTIGDVASVEREQDPLENLSRVNGESALSIAVTKLPSANTVEVSEAVTDLLPELATDLGGDVEFTIVFDQADFIEESITALSEEGALGLVFAVVVILIFLMSVRATIVTAISIPTSLLITFIGLWAFGYSMNILTLGALTISIGRVVDDSIVVIENIKRHYVGDADKMASIKLALREVAGAISSSTITTVAVFLPVAFLGDITGELFRPFAVTVTVAMLASLFVALTIVPVLAYWFLKPGAEVRDEAGNAIDPEDPAAPPSRLQKAYLPSLRWTLRHSAITIVLAVLVLAGTAALAPLMKTNFLSDSGQNTFTMSQDLGPAASLDAEDAAAAKVEEAVLGVEGIETVQASIGSSGSALADAFSGGGGGVTYSITTDADVDQVELQERVSDAVAELDDVGTVTISASDGGGFGGSSIEIDVAAPDEATLREATDAVVNSLEGLDTVSQVSTNLSSDLTYIAVEVNRDAAAALGLSEVAVGALVNAAMQPQSVGTVEIDESSLTVYLAAANPPTSVAELEQLQIPSAAGLVPLTQIATVAEEQTPTSITTQRSQRTATVTVTPSGDDLTAASAEIDEALAGADLPAAADATVGGVIADQEEAFYQLGLAMLAAILIVYVVMVATFKSLRQPLELLVSVPFAATGAILLQIITGIPLGVASLVGVLMLIGIVVTNAIVLIDLVNQYRTSGLSVHDAVVAGASRRLRPILMTALATVFALTPMALGITGNGGFISQPLAIVVIGGLVSSTALTLIVLPSLYNLIEGASERRAAKRAGGVEVWPSLDAVPVELAPEKSGGANRANPVPEGSSAEPTTEGVAEAAPSPEEHRPKHAAPADGDEEQA